MLWETTDAGLRRYVWHGTRDKLAYWLLQKNKRVLFPAFLLFRGNVGKLMGIETGAAKTAGQRAKNKQKPKAVIGRKREVTTVEWGQREGSEENQIFGCIWQRDSKMGLFTT